MDVDRLVTALDRIAAGRQATQRVPVAARADPRVLTAFRRVTQLLVVEFVLGAAAVVEAFVLTEEGDRVPLLVWWRLLVVFGIAGTLFYFVWRARLGFRWAYSRLRLFSAVFPAVAIGTCLVPGLYPAWMVVDQVAFSAVLLLVRRALSTPPVRRAYVAASTVS